MGQIRHGELVVGKVLLSCQLLLVDVQHLFKLQETDKNTVM